MIRKPALADEGFSMVELLVVIIIIGVLAAIAIPIFLKQTNSASDSAAKSDLHNLALLEETYSINASSYGTIAQISAAVQPVRVSPGVTLSVVRYKADATYCLSAMSTGSGNSYYYDSGAGGVEPRGSTTCLSTTTGTAGDSITG